MHHGLHTHAFKSNIVIQESEKESHICRSVLSNRASILELSSSVIFNRALIRACHAHITLT